MRARLELLPTTVEVVVQFHDLDPLNIAWHGNHLRWFEIARCALLQRIDYDYPTMLATGHYWPVIECHVRYARQATYGQRLAVTAAITEWENRLRMRYRMVDTADGTSVATGETLQCAVDVLTHELQWVSPRILFERLAPHLPAQAE